MADDGRAFVANYGTQTPGNSLSIVDLAALKEATRVDLGPMRRAEVKRLPLGRNPSGILVAPDGSRACAGTTGDSVVAVIDLRKLEPAGRIQTGAGSDGMAWVPEPTALDSGGWPSGL